MSRKGAQRELVGLGFTGSYQQVRRRYLKPHRVKCTGTLDKMSSSVECCRSRSSSHFEMISRNLFFKAISAGLRPPASSQL
jgi:hypothetical protein